MIPRRQCRRLPPSSPAASVEPSGLKATLRNLAWLPGSPGKRRCFQLARVTSQMWISLPFAEASNSLSGSTATHVDPRTMQDLESPHECTLHGQIVHSYLPIFSARRQEIVVKGQCTDRIEMTV